MRKLFILLIFMLPLLVFSQSRDKRSAPFTVRYNIGIPLGISSGKFRTAFKSVVESNVSFNARLFSNFFIGVGYQYTNFQNDKDVFTYHPVKDPVTGKPTNAVLPYNTHLIGHSPFIKIGYDKFFEKGFATFALNTGYSLFHYTNVVSDSTVENLPFGPTEFTAPFLQPEVSVSFLTDRSLTFSLMFSYTTVLTKFDPKGPRFAGFYQVAEKSNKYLMSWINIGFGISILIGNK